MRKTDKKIENAIREALTDVCNIALKKVPGFKWITHRVNYNNFPSSLVITCVFDNDETLHATQQSEYGKYLLQIIQQQLAAYKINVSKISSAVRFSTEAAMNKTLH